MVVVGPDVTRRILVPIDGSPPADRALEYALETFPDATITTIHVIDPIDSVYAAEAGGLPVAEDWYDDAQDRATEIHAKAEERADEFDIEIETVTEVGRPARTILQYTAEHDVSQIVIGSHGRQRIERVVLGSVAERVVRRAEVPVTVVR
ncbi:universal stress protein [Halorussus salilacus]|uniref:universal stress protein n=1 Tax=Halorussus salilacus TaxID=2953750 RepID=UPI0020A22AC2|nr:universal stress protein [Halorussus salilacus]USZ67216.1 universal stress protein [Halorussus salilacus]